MNGTGGTPATFPPDDEGDDVKVPIPAKGYVEGDNTYSGCPDGEDCHMIIFDGMKLFEVYHAHLNGSTWDGYVAFWQLDKKYPQTNRGLGCTSADAAGLPIAPGLIGYQETKKGAINHALRYIQRNEYIHGVAGDRNTPNVAYPASHGSTAGAAANGIPYGGRLRLKKTIAETDPRIKTPGARAVVRALQKYGMILADGGNIPLVAESVKVHQDANPAETWDGLLAPRDLGFIQPSDFEVIAIPKNDPSGPDGWYQTKVEYVGQLKKPLGCQGIVQP
jgi:serine/threonine-protein kinase